MGLGNQMARSAPYLTGVRVHKLILTLNPKEPLPNSPLIEVGGGNTPLKPDSPLPS